jgi:hypothetical protein
MGAIGLMGAMACILVMLMIAPPNSVDGYVFMLRAMANIATWVFFPSLAITLIAGLLAIAVNPGFHEAGWAWIKAATGILIFEGGFVYVLGPMQEAGRKSADVLAGHMPLAVLTQSFGAERNTLWLLLAIGAANVVLGVWRLRLPQIPV